MFTLLTREACGLCEEFEQALRVQLPALALTVVDVDAREDWRRRYGLRVPVLLDRWNEVVAEGHFDAAAVAAASASTRP